MNVAAIIASAATKRVRLYVNGDRLNYQGPPEAVRQLLPLLVEHKAELLEALCVPDLPAKVRSRFCEACGRLRIDPAPVLEQFDRWAYSAENLAEMNGWPSEAFEAHCRLLADEHGHRG